MIVLRHSDSCTEDASLKDHDRPLTAWGRSAAAALDIDHSGIVHAMRRVQAKAARLGYAPGHFEHGVAPGYQMGKVTVQRGADGSVERVWERQSPDDARWREGMEAASAAMCERINRSAPSCRPSLLSSTC